MIEPGFPTDVAAKLCRVNRATLDNWNGTRFLMPSIPAPRRGAWRHYSFRDLVAIRVVLDLRAAGISLQALRRVAKYLRTHKGLEGNDALANTQLVTDGHDVFEVTNDQSFSVLRRPGQRVFFVIPIAELVAELREQARALRAA
jgi:DNA-binding transcriptional MerR regulator